MRRTDRRRGVRQAPGPNAIRRTEGLPEQAFQLGYVEAVAADDAAVQEQDGDVESVAALQDGVAVDVDDFDGRQLRGSAEDLELGQHLVAEVAVVAMDDCENRGSGH